MVKIGIKDGKAIRLPIVNALAGKGEFPKFVQRIGSVLNEIGTPSPRSASPDTLHPEDAVDGGRFDKQFAAQKIENSYRLENPRLHGVHDLDCGSCHLAQPERELISEPENFRPSDKAYTSPRWNLDVVTEVPNQSLQIFSFFEGTARIAPRAINESAEAADLIRDRF